MNYVGVDLHKKSITVCVVDEKIAVKARKTLSCCEPEKIVEFFRSLKPFKVAVEATASYQWFVDLIQPLAEKVELANPNKLRVIAESIKKTDRLDAQTIAEFLARDQIPQSYQPTPRVRQHRMLVRHRKYLKEQMTAIRNKIRRLFSDYNADRTDLFSANCGRSYIKEVSFSETDRFVVTQLWDEYEYFDKQVDQLGDQIKKFVKKAPQKEAEARKLLKTIPGVGTVTTEVVLSELGDIKRFKNSKKVCAYSGLVPKVRQTGGKQSKELGITKQGSSILRWALVEASWRLVRISPKWERFYERLSKRKGGKRAIVAVARKLLSVIYAVLKTGTPYKVLLT
jgi:transposase